jgi:hypothetical protein
MAQAKAPERRGHARVSPSAHCAISRLGCSVVVVGALALLGCGGSTGGSTTVSRPARSASVASGNTGTSPLEPGLPGQPGVVTLLRLPAPAGHPTTVSLTGQLVRRNRRLDLCLYASQVELAPRGPLGSSTGQCAGPLPLAHRAIVVLLTAGWCTPRPVELVWGIALPRVRIFTVSPSGSVAASRSRIPAGLRVRGDLFYGLVRGAPVHLIARDAIGRTLTAVLVNQTPEPYGCSPRTIGPGPTGQPHYRPT